MTIKNQLFTPLVGVALLAGNFFAASAAHAALIGYEITYEVEELRISHNGSFGPADQSGYWGLVGLTAPQTIGFRLELSQDPNDIQTYPVDQNGVHVGDLRDYEFSRVDLLLDGQAAVTDMDPETSGNGALVSDAFAIAQNRDDLFSMSYNSSNPFGTGSIESIRFFFAEPFGNPAQDTWLAGLELPTVDQLVSLERPPSFATDLLGPQGGAFTLFSPSILNRPTITAIETTPVPLPASAPLILAGLAFLGAIGRRNSAMRIARF